MPQVNPYLQSRKINPYLQGRKIEPKKQPFISGPAYQPVLSSEAEKLRQRTIQGTKETALGAFETTTAGIPREIAKRTVGYDIPRGNAFGQLLGLILPASRVSGLVSKIPSIAGKGALKA